MNEKLIRLKQLDRQLQTIKNTQQPIPKQGWTRTLRKALGMTIKQLANRMSVHPSRIVKIETSEIDKAVTLHTLFKVADALNCTFTYSFIPNTNLEKNIRNRAEKIARHQLKQTGHTMELEAQSVDQDWLDAQVEAVTNELLARSWKQLWNE